MRIRFIHNYFYPDISSVSQVITDIACHLAAHGHGVSVLASKNQYARSSQRLLTSRDIHRGVTIRRMWAPSLARHSLVGRLVNQLTFMVGASLRAIFSPRADVVVLLTDPPLFAAIGLLLKRLRGERFVHVVMDLYPDVAIQFGVLRKRSLSARVMRSITGATLRGADAVVVLGACMKAKVVAYGADPARVTVITNWADPVAIQPVDHERNAFLTEHGLNGKFVVMYSGNLGVAHRFDEILTVARRFTRFEDVHFVFIGGGTRLKEVVSFRARNQLKNIHVLPYQHAERLSESLSAGDVHLVTLRSGFEGLVVPSKAYGIMAAARPIVFQGDSGSEVARMLEENGIGFVVPEGNADALESVLLRLRDDQEEARRLGLKARRILLEKYDRESSLKTYEAVFGGWTGTTAVPAAISPGDDGE